MASFAQFYTVFESVNHYTRTQLRAGGVPSTYTDQHDASRVAPLSQHLPQWDFYIVNRGGSNQSGASSNWFARRIGSDPARIGAGRTDSARRRTDSRAESAQTPLESVRVGSIRRAVELMRPSNQFDPSRIDAGRIDSERRRTDSRAESVRTPLESVRFESIRRGSN